MARSTQLAIPLAPFANETIGIGRVERETGLSKDTLRVWERRYGFPQPGRDAHGERTYSPDQIEKLRLLRRLTECGLRPGKIITLGLDELEHLSLTHGAAGAHSQDLSDFIEAMREHDLQTLRRLLSQSLMRKGLGAFVLDTVSPLCDHVADQCMRGEIEIFEGHLCAELVQGVLHGAIQAIRPEGHPPNIVIASAQIESRTIDRLMLEAVLCVGGALCIPLGAAVPLQEVAHAAGAHQAQIVVLQIPQVDPQTTRGLVQLRALLPPSVELWAMGRNLARIKKALRGVQLAGSIEQVPPLLQLWKMRHGQ